MAKECQMPAKEEFNSEDYLDDLDPVTVKAMVEIQIRQSALLEMFNARYGPREGRPSFFEQMGHGIGLALAKALNPFPKPGDAGPFSGGLMNPKNRAIPAEPVITPPPADPRSELPPEEARHRLHPVSEPRAAPEADDLSEPLPSEDVPPKFPVAQ